MRKAIIKSTIIEEIIIKERIMARILAPLPYRDFVGLPLFIVMPPE